MTQTMQVVLLFLQLFLALCNSCIMIFVFIKFINKPHDSLESRVNLLTAELAEIKQSLKLGNDRFREHDNANEVIINSVLALIEFEVQYCLLEHKEMSSGLIRAKEDLNKYLSKR